MALRNNDVVHIVNVLCDLCQTSVERKLPENSLFLLLDAMNHNRMILRHTMIVNFKSNWL